MSHTEQLVPGQRVVITQQIPQRDEVWTSQIRGTVERYEMAKTGAWFAGAKDKKLWLDRLTIRKDDGEIVVCILDGYSHIEILHPTGSGTMKSRRNSSTAEED